MLVDLSQVVNNDTPVYPGDPPVSIKPAGKFEPDGYNDHLLLIGTHVGTHIDAPYHMLADGKKLNEFPVERFVGDGVLVDLIDKKYNLESVKKAEIQEGDIVVFRSGLSEKYKEPAYFENYPVMPDDVAKYLAEKKIKMVGLDMCSPDHDEFSAHRILLAEDVLIIENLTNLDKLTGRQFKIYALPLNLDLDGSPARVIAEMKD